MLVLSRRQGQKIIIDDDIVISIVAIRNGQVRIGVDAPEHIPIVREEIKPEDTANAA